MRGRWNRGYWYVFRGLRGCAWGRLVWVGGCRWCKGGSRREVTGEVRRAGASCCVGLRMQGFQPINHGAGHFRKGPRIGLERVVFCESGKQTPRKSGQNFKNRSEVGMRTSGSAVILYVRGLRAGGSHESEVPGAERSPTLFGQQRSAKAPPAGLAPYNYRSVVTV